MHPSNNWNEKEYLKKKLPQISFDDNDIEKSIKNSKIVICTQLDTTFLYCISSNIPVLTVFDFSRVNISKKNYLLLKNLQKQKIYSKTMKNFVPILIKIIIILKIGGI